MANLVQLSNELEYVPQEQLVQMSQDPNSTYPSFLVLSEIQRRTQMKKMYEAQQPKPQTTVAEEVVQEFAGQQGLQGAMAQSPGPQNAFQPGDMGNMAPPSPMQAMASGGRTGYQVGGLFGPQNSGTLEEFKEKMIKEYIAATGKSRQEAEIFANQNAQERYNETLQSQAQQDKARKDSLLFNMSNLSDYDPLAPSSISKEQREKILETFRKEPSGFDKFIEGGTEFFFGPARPDAENPTLARMTDEPMDYLNYIPVIGTAGMYAKGGIKGLQGIMQGLRGSKVADKADDVVDLTKIPAAKVDDIVPVTSTKGLPGAMNPQRNVGSTRPNLPAVIPKKTGTDLVPRTGTDLAVIPKVTPKETKGLISRGINWLKNNKGKAFGYGLFGIGAGTVYKYSGEPEKKDTDLDLPPGKLTDNEVKRNFDPLDLAKLGGIIMGAKNTSELGDGLTALASDIQERKYKESVLESKQQAMIIDRINALSKAMENMMPNSIELQQASAARQSLIQSLYGQTPQGTDPNSILNAATANQNTEEDVTKNTESKGLGSRVSDILLKTGNPLLYLGSKLAQNYFDDKPTSVVPQSDLYNAFVKNAPNPDYLTGDPIIDNIMRVESGGRDLTNSTTGATGPLQVKEITLADPGYGVEPAKDNSVKEKIRVGKDYYIAMREEFDGNDLYASIAYNLGPGATKRWLESGGSIEQLRQIQSSDGRPVGQAAIDYITKLYGPDIITRLA